MRPDQKPTTGGEGHVKSVIEWSGRNLTLTRTTARAETEHNQKTQTRMHQNIVENTKQKPAHQDGAEIQRVPKGMLDPSRRGTIRTQPDTNKKSREKT